MSINFDEDFCNIYNVYSIKKNLRSAFSDIEAIVKMIGQNLPMFLQTGKFNTVSLKKVGNSCIIKCRIKKPGYGTSDGYRAIYFLDTESQTSKILLLYSKNDIPDNSQETQQIWKKIKQYYPDLLDKLGI